MKYDNTFNKYDNTFNIFKYGFKYLETYFYTNLYRKINLKSVFKINYLLLIFILALSSNFVNAAKISGSVYDLGLEKAQDVIIEINSTPKQFIISKDGDYFLTVGIGSYKIHAFTDTSESYESIVVADDGDYIIDLILTESISGSYIYDSLDDVDVSSDIPSSSDKSVSQGVLIAIILIVVFILGWISYSRFIVRKSKSDKNSNEHSNEDSYKRSSKKSSKNLDHGLDASLDNSLDHSLDVYEKKILSVVRKEKRTTQKDIRKEIPLSEAKISLVLADLESKGKIRKIKKGRGNIIIFVKD